MTEDFSAQNIEKRVGQHDAKTIISAASGVCNEHRTVKNRVVKAVKRLATSRHWQGEIERFSRFGISARFCQGELQQVIALPGDVAVLRNASGNLFLLQFREQRWLYIGADGMPVAEVSRGVESDGEHFDAVMFRMPIAGAPAGGFTSLATLWPELRAAWAEVGIASLFVNTGQLLVPLFSMLVYDKIAQNGLFETLWALVIGMGLYLATDIAMRMVRSWATEHIGEDLSRRSDEVLWTKLMAQVDLPAGGFPRFISNYRDLTLARDFVSSSYLLAIADIPFLFLFITVVGVIAWQLMLVVILLIIIYAVAGIFLQARQNELSKEAEHTNTRKLAFMGETLNCLDIVRTTPGAWAFLRRWRDVAELSTGADARRRLAMMHTGMLSASTYTVSTVVVLTVGVYLMHAQLLSSGQLIACSLLASRAMALVASLFSVTGKWQDFTRAAASMESSLEPVSERECTPRPAISGHISVLGLGKHYEGRPAALENVSFTVMPGERIALLGRPGAGKSTLLQCLAGVCRPDMGQIMIDGLAFDDISRFDRVRWLAYKGQEPALFAGTLEDNLRISGCHDHNRFSAAIWASGLENELKSGRMTLGMQLAERGGNLSGGQRQKVALARALAQSSTILLLDEPTLGLDPESERLLAERLPQLLGSQTTLFMTTHSAIMLETVKRVIALDGGRVVADGLREKLVTLS